MKTLKLLLATVTAGLLLMASRCEEEDTNTLPPETREGKNTFGCLIDGKMFNDIKKPVHWGVPPLSAIYSISAKILSISAGKYDDYIGITVFYPQENESKVIDYASYVLMSNREPCSSFRSRNMGEIVLTRFDTINRIVSGRFHFTGQCADIHSNPLEGPTMHITEGRFDIKLELYD